jgi:hypothetical protein
VAQHLIAAPDKIIVFQKGNTSTVLPFFISLLCATTTPSAILVVFGQVLYRNFVDSVSSFIDSIIRCIPHNGYY